MARNTRKEQAAETREKLLAAAKALFAEHGYHATPVRAINRELKMGDGILYHYFPGGKREILSVLLQESMQLRIDTLQQTRVAIEQMDLREALLTIYERLHSLFMEDKEFTKIMMREKELLALEEGDKLSDFFLQQNQVVTEFLIKRHAQGEIRKLNFEMATRQFLSMGLQSIFASIIGIKLTQQGYNLKKDHEDIVDYTMALWKNP